MIPREPLIKVGMPDRSSRDGRFVHCRSVAILLALIVLSGCSGLAPVYSIGERTTGSYTIKKGDTLYSVAFRYGLDYKVVAKNNGIAPPYMIFVGQTLKLYKPAQARKDSGPMPQPDSKSKSSKPAIAVKTPPLSAPVSLAHWQWPLIGKVISAYSLKNPVNKGIDIEGKRGSAVNAAADGVVVYAGGNLRGYGKLVIVKHSDRFLSAYGNNETMLVEEGQQVKAGHRIAKVGRSAANVEMLHFEIRQDGKPVDPLNYLPKRVQ